VTSEQLYSDVCLSRYLVSVHEVKPVRLSIAMRCVWQQLSRA